MFALCATLLLFLSSVVANDLGNYFFSPSDNSGLTWRAGTLQTVSWTTLATVAYNVTLFQQTTQDGVSFAKEGPVVHSLPVGSTGRQSFNWTVDYTGLSLSDSKTFLFWVNHGGDISASSGYFSISPAPGTVVSTSTSSSATSTLMSATSASTTSTSSTATSASSTPVADIANNGSTSNATAVGAGVGVAVAVALIALAGIVVYFLRRRNQKKAAAVPHSSAGYSSVPGAATLPHDYMGMQQHHHAPIELPEKERAYHEVTAERSAQGQTYHEVTAERRAQELP